MSTSFTKNILIQNNHNITHEIYCMDNLTFLKHAQTVYIDSIDFCYLDLPYNTGNTHKDGFTYNDKFYTPTDENKHTSWLTFMKERLTQLKPLLKETGILTISIDDSEIHHLRILLDKIFGEQNFIAQMVIDGGAMKNNARFISTTHEYLLVYAKNLNVLNKTNIKWRTHRDGIDLLLKQEKLLRKQYGKDYKQMTTALREWMKTSNLSKRLKLFYNVDEKGLYTFADLSAPNSKQHYDYPHPVTGKPVKKPSRGWAYSFDRLDEMAWRGEIEFFDNETWQPLKKHYLEDTEDQVVKSVLGEFPARSSTHLLEHMLGRRSSFNNPKNLDFIKFLIKTMCPTDGVVLDFFAGSGTTAHAVLELNKNGGQRTSVSCTNNENNIYVDVLKPRIIAAATGIWGDGSTHVSTSENLVEYLEK